MAASVAAAIAAARAKLGARYIWGAEGPDTFDCSGLMVWAWNKAGVKLPRTSQEQAKFGTAVPLAKIQPGDLITSDWGSGPSSHVGMYLGGGKLIHAPRPGSVVKIADLDASYRSHINTVRRVPGATTSGVEPALSIPGPGDLWHGLGELFGGTASGALDSLKAVTSSLSDAGTALLSVGKFAEFLLKLALPSTWVRIASGALGTVLLFLGLGFLVREASGGA